MGKVLLEEAVHHLAELPVVGADDVAAVLDLGVGGLDGGAGGHLDEVVEHVNGVAGDGGLTVGSGVVADHVVVVGGILVVVGHAHAVKGVGHGGASVDEEDVGALGLAGLEGHDGLDGVLDEDLALDGDGGVAGKVGAVVLDDVGAGDAHVHDLAGDLNGVGEDAIDVVVALGTEVGVLDGVGSLEADGAVALLHVLAALVAGAALHVDHRSLVVGHLDGEGDGVLVTGLVADLVLKVVDANVLGVLVEVAGGAGGAVDDVAVGVGLLPAHLNEVGVGEEVVVVALVGEGHLGGVGELHAADLGGGDGAAVLGPALADVLAVELATSASVVMDEVLAPGSVEARGGLGASGASVSEGALVGSVGRDLEHADGVVLVDGVAVAAADMSLASHGLANAAGISVPLSLPVLEFHVHGGGGSVLDDDVALVLLDVAGAVGALLAEEALGGLEALLAVVAGRGGREDLVGVSGEVVAGLPVLAAVDLAGHVGGEVGGVLDGAELVVTAHGLGEVVAEGLHVLAGGVLGVGEVVAAESDPGKGGVLLDGGVALEGLVNGDGDEGLGVVLVLLGLVGAVLVAVHGVGALVVLVVELVVDLGVVDVLGVDGGGGSVSDGADELGGGHVVGAALAVEAGGVGAADVDGDLLADVGTEDLVPGVLAVVGGLGASGEGGGGAIGGSGHGDLLVGGALNRLGGSGGEASGVKGLLVSARHGAVTHLGKGLLVSANLEAGLELVGGDLGGSLVIHDEHEGDLLGGVAGGVLSVVGEKVGATDLTGLLASAVSHTGEGGGGGLGGHALLHLLVKVDLAVLGINSDAAGVGLSVKVVVDASLGELAVGGLVERVSGVGLALLDEVHAILVVAVVLTVVVVDARLEGTIGEGVLAVGSGGKLTVVDLGREGTGEVELNARGRGGSAQGDSRDEACGAEHGARLGC